MLIAFRNHSAQGIKETTTTQNPNILTAEAQYQQITIRYILCYGPQEDAKQNDRLEFYEDLSIEVENSLISNTIPVILGDLNAKLVSTSNEELNATSDNGTLLKDIIDKYGLSVCNFHDKAEGYYSSNNKKWKN